VGGRFEKLEDKSRLGKKHEEGAAESTNKKGKERERENTDANRKGSARD